MLLKDTWDIRLPPSHSQGCRVIQEEQKVALSDLRKHYPVPMPLY